MTNVGGMNGRGTICALGKDWFTPLLILLFNFLELIIDVLAGLSCKEGLLALIGDNYFVEIIIEVMACFCWENGGSLASSDKAWQFWQ